MSARVCTVRHVPGSESQAKCPTHGGLPMIPHATQRKKSEAAKSRTAQPRLLEGLSKDDDKSVRCNVAANALTPLPALRSLAQDRYWPVRMAVARNPRTPPELVDALVRDDDHMVRGAAMVRVRVIMSHLLGVSTSNAEACNAMLEHSRWWELDRDGPEATLVRAMHPNQ